jgi:hypothetical protein
LFIGSPSVRTPPLTKSKIEAERGLVPNQRGVLRRATSASCVACSGDGAASERCASARLSNGVEWRPTRRANVAQPRWFGRSRSGGVRRPDGFASRRARVGIPHAPLQETACLQDLSAWRFQTRQQRCERDASGPKSIRVNRCRVASSHVRRSRVTSSNDAACHAGGCGLESSHSRLSKCLETGHFMLPTETRCSSPVAQTWSVVSEKKGLQIGFLETSL